MGDGGISYFLIFIFVLWVLETIAKARRRSRMPEEDEREPQLSPPPTAGELGEPAPRPTQRAPRTLWEEIAEIARQQLPPEQLPQGPVERPTAQHREGAQAPPAAPARAGASRWEQGAEMQPLQRPERPHPPAVEERTSDRWTEGGAGWGTPRAQREERLERAAERTAARRPQTIPGRDGGTAPSPPARTSPRRREGARGTGRVPAVRPPREVTRTQPPAVPAVVVSPPRPAAGGTAASLLNVHALRGASRADLRRLLVLQEVLGPPLALRDEHDPRD